MKRIIYDYQNPHIVGRARQSFPIGKVIVAIIVISLAVALTYILFFKGSSLEYESKEYFALIIGRYDSQSAADYVAEDIKLRGGGGYVYKDERYNVVASVYQSEEDAIIVAQRYGWEVESTGKYSVKANLNDSSLSQRAVELCKYPEQLVEGLYTLSDSLDKGEISGAAALYALTDYAKLIQENKNELVRIRENFSSDKLLSEAEKMYVDLSLSLSKENSYSVSSRIKYCLGEVTFIYKSFLISIR